MTQNPDYENGDTVTLDTEFTVVEEFTPSEADYFDEPHVEVFRKGSYITVPKSEVTRAE